MAAQGWYGLFPVCKCVENILFDLSFSIIRIFENWPIIMWLKNDQVRRDINKYHQHYVSWIDESWCSMHVPEFPKLIANIWSSFANISLKKDNETSIGDDTQITKSMRFDDVLNIYSIFWLRWGINPFNR